MGLQMISLKGVSFYFLEQLTELNPKKDHSEI
ncbi:hypothetical protein Za10_1303 [Zymomonas mobilis subsp. mobilis NCIMB 11163]|nr:hypothetical protein Za10_1303 [Zymomonas mobilis subsp. mobilis NCIMB 11163]